MRDFFFSLIALDAKMTGSLEWNRELEKAAEAVNAGRKILWDVQMGLFSELNYPASNGMQMRALELALEHVVEKAWDPFAEQSLGLLLFHGSIPWQKEEEIELLHQLILSIPSEIPLYLHLDCEKVPDAVRQLLLLHPEKVLHCRLILENAFFPPASHLFRGFVEAGRKDAEMPYAICLPALSFLEKSPPSILQDLFQVFQSQNLPLRWIPEEVLTQEWQGLDWIFYFPQALTHQGKRKLLGFAAAGGTIVSLGAVSGLPGEISWDEFIRHSRLSLGV